MKKFIRVARRKHDENVKVVGRLRSMDRSSGTIDGVNNVDPTVSQV